MSLLQDPAAIPAAAVDCWSIASHDIDEQAALLPGWQQAYVQLECGRLDSRVDGVTLPGAAGLFRKRTNRKLHKTFSTPADTCALALLTADSEHIRFQDCEARPGDALLLPPGQAFDIVSHGRFDVLVTTFPCARLPAPQGLRPAVLRADDDLRRLRGLAQALLSGPPCRDAGMAGHRQLHNLLADLEERLLDRLAADAAGVPDAAAPGPLAAATLQAARRILEEETLGVGEVPSVSDLAGRLGVSVRLLHQVFRQRLGVPPRLYAQSLRLSRARADLRAARAGEVTVAEIAVRWGFWHLGRFASTYRATFGELPSQSLQH